MWNKLLQPLVPRVSRSQTYQGHQLVLVVGDSTYLGADCPGSCHCYCSWHCGFDCCRLSAKEQALVNYPKYGNYYHFNCSTAKDR